MKPQRPNSLPLQKRLFSRSRPSIPEALVNRVVDYLAQKLEPPFEQAVDVGCGTGLSSAKLGPHFHTVLGLDTSTTQVEEAKKSNFFQSISYQVGSASTIPCTSASVDLVFCCQSFHWFDADRFWKECDRILRPHGVVAICGYGLCKLECATPAKTDALNGILQHLHEEVLWKGGYWEKERKFIDSQYEGLSLPYQDQIIARDDPELYLKRSMTLDLLMDYIGTWSGLRAYQRQNPDHDIADEYTQKLLSAMEESCSSAAMVDVVFPWFMLMCRKSASDSI